MKILFLVIGYQSMGMRISEYGNENENIRVWE